MELLLQGLGEGREGEARQALHMLEEWQAVADRDGLVAGPDDEQQHLVGQGDDRQLGYSAADIGVPSTLPGYPCAKLQRVPHHRLAAAFRRATMDFVRFPLSRMARAAHLQPGPLRLRAATTPQKRCRTPSRVGLLYLSYTD